MSVSDRTGVFHVLGPAHLPSPASGVPDRIRATQQMSPHAEALTSPHLTALHVWATRPWPGDKISVCFLNASENNTSGDFLHLPC